MKRLERLAARQEANKAYRTRWDAAHEGEKAAKLGYFLEQRIHGVQKSVATVGHGVDAGAFTGYRATQRTAFDGPGGKRPGTLQTTAVGAGKQARKITDEIGRLRKRKKRGKRKRFRDLAADAAASAAMGTLADADAPDNKRFQRMTQRGR